MQPLPHFKPGDIPLARDFACLVSAIRELQAWHRSAPPLRTPCRRPVFFDIAATAIARDADAAHVAAYVTESLYQVGGSVALQKGGTVSGVEEVMQSAGSDTLVGLHADYSGDSPAFSAVPWVEEQEADDGTIFEGTGPWHGSTQCGVILPAPGVRDQRQRVIAMWPMPQHPRTIDRDYWWPEFQGASTLLPGPAQVIANTPLYYASEEGDTARIPHNWTGRLDMWGGLHINFT